MTDIILHDCEYLYFDGVPFKSGVHAHYEDLKTLDPDTKKKIRMVHYQDSFRDVIVNGTLNVVDDGFDHPLAMGDVVEV